MKNKFISLGFFFLACQMQAHSQDCRAFIRDLLDYAQKNSHNLIDFKMVALAKNGKWGQYTEGTLRYYKNSSATLPGGILNPGSEGLSGSAKQYFSDRMDRCNSNEWVIDYWFSKFKADDLGLTIDVPILPSSGCNTPLTLTLKTWGGGKYTFCPVCSGGYMYLLENGMVIVFTKSKE